MTAVARVLIVYKTLPHYRVDFFDRLRTKLAADNIELELVVGQPDPLAAAKNDTASLPWATHVDSRFIRVRGRTVVWQPVLGRARHADLVIVEQASKLLVNSVFQLWRKARGPKFALWGHGVNLDQGKASKLGEWWKRRTLTACDWWFGYTEGTERILRKGGVSPERITVVQNAIDTTALSMMRHSMSASAVQETAARLGIDSAHVAVFIGSLYGAKRLPFLVSAADLIRAQLPDFHLVVIGDGPERSVLNDAAKTRPWLHVVGQLRGEDLVRHASIGSVLVMPGLVGLAVLDAFALELPMVTCAVANHSPEIEYLKHGENGLIIDDAESPEAYAREVADLLTDAERLAHLRLGCRAAAERYTVDEMVDRFRNGVVLALKTP